MKKGFIMRHISLRIEGETLAKLRYVCEYEGRSINRQLLRMINKLIVQFENAQGKITFE